MLGCLNEVAVVFLYSRVRLVFPDTGKGRGRTYRFLFLQAQPLAVTFIISIGDQKMSVVTDTMLYIGGAI